MDRPSTQLAGVSSSGRITDEFPNGASQWPSDLNRREFLHLMGASLALAGLAGCARKPNEAIVPYVNPPEKTPSTEFAWYATAMPWQGFARGILAKSVQGRPVKIEGNPEHPESFGATDPQTQAAVLSLYDPQRSTTPRRGNQISTWTQFEQEWLARMPELQRSRGAGLALLTEPTTSPTQLREILALLAAWPEARWFQSTPLARYDQAGAQDDFDFFAADVILSLGSDRFYHHPAALRSVRDFSARRRLVDGKINLNRFFALEPTLTLTGAQADVRLGVSIARMSEILNALGDAIDERPVSAELSASERRMVDDCATQVRAPGKKAVCVVGEEMPDEFRAWAAAFNQRFARGAMRTRAAVRSDGDPRVQGGLAELVRAMAGNAISALCILGGNPVATEPGSLKFSEVIKRVPFIVHVGEHVDETAHLCSWHLPESHFLESWGDLRAYSGAATVVQPLISPLHAGRSLIEVLHQLRTGEARAGYELVRETWGSASRTDFESNWHRWLTRGVVDGEAEGGAEKATTVGATSTAFPRLTSLKSAGALSILFRPDANLWDGRFADNGWLQELPRPFTCLVWGNAALISAELAKSLVLKNGDVIRCRADAEVMEAPVWILPGQAPDCITLPLVSGGAAAGSANEAEPNAVFSAFSLRTTETPWQRDGVTIEATGRRVELVSTQGHFTLEGRDLARAITADELDRPPAAAKPAVSLYPEWPRGRYAWAMAIDLSTCYGCNACVVACQAENNIPVVGRDQVARGREMHWLRVDRYFSEEQGTLRVMHQPLPCMHCEHAPCEVVCPVGATVHSSEGLNDMVYNRCVGTRYCSNNCPYKVRRFNFLDYRAPAGSPLYQQSNPDVTIRERGVMEKCTYCVQRINAGRITAEKENRRVRDGEVRTACQQACPVDAIVFGDLNDPTSRVVQRKREKTNYVLLDELNTKPRTTYLAKVLPAGAAGVQRSKEGSSA